MRRLYRPERDVTWKIKPRATAQLADEMNLEVKPIVIILHKFFTPPV
jgi:hypothetical protein